MEDDFSAWDDLSLKSKAARQFTIDRMHAAAKLIAALELSAWRNSAHVDLPRWLDRDIYDKGFDESKIPPQPNQSSK